MRQFQILDQIDIDTNNGMMSLTSKSAEYAQLAMRREGAYVVISASYGPLEIALRPRYEDLVRLLARLQPVEGLQTTRQVGTSQAYLAIGLRADGALIMRPTIVADATGYLTLNMALNPNIRRAFHDWLGVEGS